MRLKMSPTNSRIPCIPGKAILGRGKATKQAAGQTMTGDAGMAKNRVRPIRPKLHLVGSRFLANVVEVEDRRMHRPTGAAVLLHPLTTDDGGSFPRCLRLQRFRMAYLQLGMESIRIRISNHT